MGANRIGTQIEKRIQKGEWTQVQALHKEPDDHWLWARLAAVKYEQRNYQAALTAAEKALEIVPDCPLALWSKASAKEMLGATSDAMRLYSQLLKRGLEELKHPDADANECWEGPDWTAGLMADCVFQSAGCVAKQGQRDRAVDMYQGFLQLQDFGISGIHSREDALAELKRLVPNKNARREAAMKRIRKMGLLPAKSR